MNQKVNGNNVDAETIYAVPYDVPVIGNDTINTNTLRLWSAEPSEDFPSNHDFQRYIEDVRSICQNLYPDDSTPAGKNVTFKTRIFLLFSRYPSNHQSTLKKLSIIR
mgnify:CR=1 FL=1